MYHKKHLPAGIVLSGTEEGNHFYSEFIPDLFVYGDYDRDAIERVMARQRKLVGAGKQNCGAFMLLDDCMYDSKVFEGYLYPPVLHEWTTLEDILHVDDAIRDGPPTRPKSQRRLRLSSSGRTLFKIEKNCTNPFLVSSPPSICFVK